MIGHAHLDPAWMWRMPEGFEAFAATCRSALDRIGEFPPDGQSSGDDRSSGFIFTASSAAHYAFVEETDPKLFSEIQEAMRKERWAIVGGWWVEADCNLPSGESFVRQALLGQRYFQSRFGKIATVGYNIDSFGHNANLPQLLRKAGLTSYVFMRPQQDEKLLDAALFNWEAPSGDEVTAYRLPLHYSNWQHSVREKIELLPSYPLFTPKQPWMIFFGVGNHGGGPTIAQLREIEALRREGNEIEYSDPIRFFANVDRNSLPVIRGEMQPHAIGCYSAHSEIKKLNRRTERAILTAERIKVLEHLTKYFLPTTPPPSPLLLAEEGELAQAWKNLCFNQFHDLLGGVAIEEACDDAISMYREAISIAERVQRTALQRIASRIDTSGHIENLIVFNLSAHGREESIEFELWHPEASERGEILGSVHLVANDGHKFPTQKIESSGKIGDDRVRFLTKVHVPAFGWNVFGIERSAKPETDILDDVKLPFTHTPAIIVRDDSDTWGHGLTSFTNYESEFHVDGKEIIERGPIRSGIRIKSSGGASRMEEEIFIEPESNVIELRVFLDWHEKHRILKLRFRHGCIDPVAHYEIPYAWIERPIGPEEWPGQSWLDVSERDRSRGFAIVTDSKYSYSVDEEYIYVIAARSPLFAHHAPPHVTREGERERYQDQGEQEFRMLLIPHEGEWSGRHISRLQNPLILHTESRHDGILPRSFAGLERKSTAIHVGAIKMAEEGDGIILRAVEQAGQASEAEFGFPTLGAHWNTSFSPFEIKSFLVQDERVTEVDFLERPL
jgi:alpha-mannosidase